MSEDFWGPRGWMHREDGPRKDAKSAYTVSCQYEGAKDGAEEKARVHPEYKEVLL